MDFDEIKEYKKKLVRERIYELNKDYDEEVGLFGYYKNEKSVIHSKVTGMVHGTAENSEYVRLVFFAEVEEYYDRARDILKKLCNVQDKNPNSRTCGLWSYYFEESLEEMSAPDYNFAEFVGSSMIYVMEEKRDLIDDELAEMLKETLRLAAKCCIRRNVGIDYTNAVCMSVFTIITIGEIIGDEEIFKIGKNEMTRLWEYTRFNGAFSEYNSPCYVKVAADAIAKMQMYIKDEECRKMADDLNDYIWEMVATHYNTKLDQFVPPHTRLYHDWEAEETPLFIWVATNGKYGKPSKEFSIYELNDLRCPEKYYPLFEKDGWVEKTYYKKNNLRTLDEDVTIVRDIDSPDLIAYSYSDDKFLFGALQKTELWVQRRTLTTYWDKEAKNTLSLKCIKNNFDFASGMSYTAQYKNKAITMLGFATDHGDTHYILDLFKDGKIKAKNLSFMFKLDSKAKKLRFEQQDDMYVLNDGDFNINIKIEKWIYDGKEGTVRNTDEGLELLCFEGDAEREVDLTSLDKTYAVISYAINEMPLDVEIKEDGERVIIKSDDKYLIEGYTKPQEYNNCIRNTVVKTNI